MPFGEIFTVNISPKAHQIVFLSNQPRVRLSTVTWNLRTFYSRSWILRIGYSTLWSKPCILCIFGFACRLYILPCGQNISRLCKIALYLPKILLKQFSAPKFGMKLCLIGMKMFVNFQINRTKTFHFLRLICYFSHLAFSSRDFRMLKVWKYNNPYNSSFSYPIDLKFCQYVQQAKRY